MITGLHHAGISVRDLDRSIQFYCALLGMELLTQGPFEGDAIERITKLNGARGRGAMLRAGAQHLELFEFATPAPKQSEGQRPVCDHGISHFCILVADLQREYERLAAAGVAFHCPPQPFGEDMRATYARDPDGNVVELLEICASDS